jgi:Ni,Fe-hydrogenase III large subunit
MDNWRDNSPIEIAKFAICGLCFFVHVVNYTIAIEKPFMCSGKK